MSDTIDRFAPGTLWPRIVERSREALACGALHPIATETRTIADSGVHFDVHVVSSLTRKIADGLGRWPSTDKKPSNPFLPYEEDLFVADISATHLCLLNKYNVIDHHLLIITRAFEPQESLLSRADFEALWSCLAEFDALGFYNSGPLAGASQPHKHLQLVPLPLSRSAPDIPTSVLFGQPTKIGQRIQLPKLPFRHEFAWLLFAEADAPRTLAERTYLLYRELLAGAGIGLNGARTDPYNLLVTRRYMLLIPRRVDRIDWVAVNALGFAGSFFVGRQESLEKVVQTGPMAILKAVTFPREAAS